MSLTYRRTRVLALAVLAVAVVALAGCGQQAATPSERVSHTVTASGSGTIQAAPDEARMSFGISKESPNAKSLLADTSKAATRIVAALKKAGIAEKDIQTQNVSLYPQTNFSNGKTVVTGYNASIEVNVKVRDLATLGDVIAAGTDAGANTVNGPSFDIAEDSPFTAQAIDKAVADARRNAEAMAKAAGGSVGRVVSISDAGMAPVQPLAFRATKDLSASSLPVPINPGQMDVTSDVVVVFELK